MKAIINRYSAGRNRVMLTLPMITLLILVITACSGTPTTEPPVEGEAVEVTAANGEETNTADPTTESASEATENTIALDREVTRDLGSMGSLSFQFPEDWVIMDSTGTVVFAYNEPGVETRTTNLQPGDIWLEIATSNLGDSDPAAQVREMTQLMSGVEFSEPELIEVGDRQAAAIHGVNSRCGGCETQLMAMQNADGTYILITVYMNPESFEMYQPFLRDLAETIVWTQES